MPRSSPSTASPIASRRRANAPSYAPASGAVPKERVSHEPRAGADRHNLTAPAAGGGVQKEGARHDPRAGADRHTPPAPARARPGEAPPRSILWFDQDGHPVAPPCAPGAGARGGGPGSQRGTAVGGAPRP